MHMSGAAPVSETLTRELAGVCKACFTGDAAAGRGRAVHIAPRVRDAFVRDLDPSAPTFPPTLGELTRRLKAWRAKLQADLEGRLPATLRLEDECRALLELQVHEIEIPGQYLAGRELAPDGVVYLERVRPDVAVVRRAAGSFRRVAMVGSDGRARHFLLHAGQSAPHPHADERLLQLARLGNALLARKPDARRRALEWYTPAIVGVWPHLRLIEEDPSTASYYEPYEVRQPKGGGGGCSLCVVCVWLLCVVCVLCVIVCGVVWLLCVRVVVWVVVLSLCVVVFICDVLLCVVGFRVEEGERRRFHTTTPAPQTTQTPPPPNPTPNQNDNQKQRSTARASAASPTCRCCASRSAWQGPTGPTSPTPRARCASRRTRRSASAW